MNEQNKNNNENNEENNEQKPEIEPKKEKKKKITEVEVNNEEDLLKILEEFKNDRRIVIRGLSINIVKNDVLSFLLVLAINALLICGTLAIFRPIDSDKLWLSIFLFIAIFTIIDYVLRYCIYRYFQKLFILSLGIISLVATIIAIVLATLFCYAFYWTITSTWLLIGSMATFIILRIIITTLIKRRNSI